MKTARTLCLLSALVILLSATGTAQESPQLPVKKVVLYKNGMGYFEHLGSVRGSQSVDIILPGSQLNDVLKSLTVIDLGGGQVTGVGYDSTEPLDRRLAALPVNPATADGLVGFLNQVRGTGVEAKTPGGVVTGKLLGAEKRMRNSGPSGATEYVQLGVYTPTGEVRLVELETAGGIRLTDPALSADLGRYLDILSTAHQRDVRHLRIQAAGQGERQLYVAYTSESPIWKTTYRVVLDPKQKPLLQGWAIVDNTTPNDWTGVALSLVAGAPVSFIQNLSQPIYARRPVVPLPQGVQVSPQLHESTLATAAGQSGIAGSVRDASGAPVVGATVRVLDDSGNEVDSTETGSMGTYQLSVPAGTYRAVADLTGFQTQSYGGVTVHRDRSTALDFRLQVGSIAESIMIGASNEGTVRMKAARPAMMAAAPPPPPPAPAMPEMADAMRKQAVPAAATQALGEQFEYRLRQPVTIRRNESALLPVVNSEIGGEKVSLYSDSNEKNPRLAVWLKNSSGLTLDGGAVTVIDTNAFAGEGIVETIQPGESRLISYAVDLGTEVSSAAGMDRQRVERVVINRGLIRRHSRVIEKRTYTVRNNDEKPRVVILEHAVRGNWSLVETPQPAETTAGHYRFRVEARPRTTTEFTVREESPQESSFLVSSVTPEQITMWVEAKQLDPETEKALRTITAKKNEIDEIARRISSLDREQADIFRDQERVRSNVQRLGQSPDEAALRQRYVRQLDQQETRIGAMRAERDKLESSRAALQKQLDEMIQNMSVDRKL